MPEAPSEESVGPQGPSLHLQGLRGEARESVALRRDAQLHGGRRLEADEAGGGLRRRRNTISSDPASRSVSASNAWPVGHTYHCWTVRRPWLLPAVDLKRSSLRALFGGLRCRTWAGDTRGAARLALLSLAAPQIEADMTCAMVSELRLRVCEDKVGAPEAQRVQGKYTWRSDELTSPSAGV